MQEASKAIEDSVTPTIDHTKEVVRINVKGEVKIVPDKVTNSYGEFLRAFRETHKTAWEV